MIDRSKIISLIGEGKISSIFDFLLLFGNLEEVSGDFPGQIIDIGGERMNIPSSKKGFRQINEDSTFLALEDFKVILNDLVEQRKIILRQVPFNPENNPSFFKLLKSNGRELDKRFAEENWTWFYKKIIPIQY